MDTNTNITDLTAERDECWKRERRARYEGRLDNASYWAGKAEALTIRIARVA